MSARGTTGAVASAPPQFSVDNEDATTGGNSAPPSYEAAMNDLTKPPYPVGGASGMPHPENSPYSTSTGYGLTRPPYPTGNVIGMPVPSHVSQTTHPLPNASSGAPLIPMPISSNASVPLNQFSSDHHLEYQPQVRDWRRGQRCDSTRIWVGCVVTFVVIGMIIFAVVKYRLAH